ncbi:hypothetical protein FQR65_LT13225 [Abscondita terminalis]|nr:hypothetical protein FQR65_LT13225 [Abscondita terminalis]
MATVGDSIQLTEKFYDLRLNLPPTSIQIENEKLDEKNDYNLTLEEIYKLALSFYKEKEGKAIHLSYEDKLSLVAFSQQVSHGPLSEAISKLPPLGALDVVGRDRRLAWQKLGKLDFDQARAGFVELLSRRCPLFTAFLEAHRMEKREQERLAKEEEKRKLIEREEKLKKEAEEKLLQEQIQKEEAIKRQIQQALNEQTFEQFRNYAKLQYPGDPEKQGTLVRQLQEQHYIQYMQQLQAAQRGDIITNDNVEKEVETVHQSNTSFKEDINSNTKGSLEETLVPASMWTRSDIQAFKQTISQAEGDSVVRVGHGETVTVRVPTHKEGARIFWEFATDYYDIGFGVYFEYGTPTTDQVSVHVSESDDEDMQDMEDLEDDEIIHPSDFEAGPLSTDTSPKPIIMEIVPVYRRDCQNEVYAGSHQYPGQGVYLLKFDNSYSLWRSKTLYYRSIFINITSLNGDGHCVVMGKHKEKKSKKHKKEKKHKKKDRRYSSSSKSSDEWIEKEPTSDSPQVGSSRDEWMSLPTTFLSTSHIDKRLERQINKNMEKEKEMYNPKVNPRELNPYWKDGGDGLPRFQKPSEDSSYTYESSARKTLPASWRKHKLEPNDEPQSSTSINNQMPVVSSSDLNAIAARLVKAEIMGDNALVEELKDKLEKARQQKLNTFEDNFAEQDVILTQTDSKGYSRPLKAVSEYGEYSGGKHKKQKVETHVDNQRVRYFPDDDKYSLKQMFESEKYNTMEDANRDFIEMAGRISKNDDLDDFFTDNIRRKESAEKVDKRNKEKAINQHRETVEALDNCTCCIQSEKMLKHLMVSMSDTVYVSLPPYEPLTNGHCLLVPVRHISCSTQLDENEWEEMLNFRKALTKMFRSKEEDVIFFETAMFLHRHPHMVLHCIPVPKEQGDLAPIYFKKAIDESEMEWATNKKLVSLAGRDVRRAIPKGLPYFSVSFGMDEGFAHVIEDQRLFPMNFAQEIIGGILDLHHSKWRKPKMQRFEEQKQRVLEFSAEWKKYDCTETK